jgi:hypothetical protein
LGAGAYATYQYMNSSSETTSQAAPSATANDKADTKLKDKAIAKVCTSCPPPCAHLGCGIPGAAYRGGAHGCMALPTGDGKDSHHMPADSVSPVPRSMGPSIQMDPADHRMTASYGGRVNGPTYAAQRAALSRGQSYAAFLMDVADAKRVAALSGDPSKYDGAIAQATLYASCLKKHGFMN